MCTYFRTRMIAYAIFGALFSFLLAPVCRGDDRTENEETLKSIVRLHRELGLPAPPPNSKLAKTLTGYDKNKKYDYTIAILLPASQQNPKPTILDRGSVLEVHYPFDIQELPPNTTTLRQLEYKLYNNLFLAIYCNILGWDDMALVFIDEIRDHGEIHLCRDSLLYHALGYWRGQISEPKIDRKSVLNKLRQLQKLKPAYFGLDKQMELKWLELALQPSSAKPGSIHALIDQLIDETYRDEHYQFTYGDAYWRIASMGFEAVPALIEHLEDERLTRGVFWQYAKVTFGLQVKHIVSDMLEGLAGEYLNRGNFPDNVTNGNGGRGRLIMAQGVPISNTGTEPRKGWLFRELGCTVLKSSAQEWWHKTKNRDEKAYFLERALLGRDKEHNGSSACEHAIRVIEAKYPEQLPVLYRLVLEKRHDLSSVELAGAIARSSLPLKEKLFYLWDGATHADLAHAEPALNALFKLDNKRAVDYLIQVIDAIPAKGNEGFEDDRNLWLTFSFVMETFDPRVLEALYQAIQRANVYHRVFLMRALAVARDPRLMSQRIKLLGKFLEDKTIWDLRLEKTDYDKDDFAYYGVMEMRDVAAMLICKISYMPVEPDPKRTQEDWLAIRARGKQLVAQVAK